jgi:tubby and related proteins
MTKRYELDFRERAGRMGYKVQTSVKNFQMTLEVVAFHSRLAI